MAKTPRILVDFNEMWSDHEVLLSKEDTRVDSDGNEIQLSAGLAVGVYTDDEDEFGVPDRLIADGVVVRNHYGEWTAAARWLLRIDERGVRHESHE